MTYGVTVQDLKLNYLPEPSYLYYITLHYITFKNFLRECNFFFKDSTTTTGGLKKDITGMVQNKNSDILIGSVVGSIGIVTLVILFIATTTLCYILWR